MSLIFRHYNLFICGLLLEIFFEYSLNIKQNPKTFKSVDYSGTVYFKMSCKLTNKYKCCCERNKVQSLKL